MIKIITDSSSNLTVEEAKELGVILMPLTISFGTEEYRDGIDIDCDTFYKKLETAKTLPHSSQLTEEQVEQAVKTALTEADEVLIMPLASVLSGSYERCKAIAEKFENIYAYDTKCTTVMLKAMVMEAVANSQKSVEEVIKILDDYRPKLKLYAVLDTLENLRKGGRLSGASAFLGTMLKIKPVITFDENGKVELISKQLGMNKGIGYLTSKINPQNIDFTKPIFLIYTGDDKNSQTLIDKLGIEYTEKANICPVIGVHIGKSAAGLVFAEK